MQACLFLPLSVLLTQGQCHTGCPGTRFWPGLQASRDAGVISLGTPSALPGQRLPRGQPRGHHVLLDVKWGGALSPEMLKSENANRIQEGLAQIISDKVVMIITTPGTSIVYC